jgi:hypothetical protein
MSKNSGFGLVLAFVFVFLIIFAGGLGVIFGIPPNRNSVQEVRPKVSLDPYEALGFATSVKISGVQYSVWDIRDNRTKLFKFMLLANPADGKIVADPKVESKAFSIRLALQCAYVLVALHDRASQAGQVASSLVALGGVASRTAQVLGDSSIANSIDDLTSYVEKGSGSSAAILSVLNGAVPYANQLIADPSDQNADLFMTSLGATALLTYSQQAAFAYLILANALQDIGISCGPWLISFYNLVTGGNRPSLSLMTLTFGDYESSVTMDQLSTRVANEE